MNPLDGSCQKLQTCVCICQSCAEKTVASFFLDTVYSGTMLPFCSINRACVRVCVCALNRVYTLRLTAVYKRTIWWWIIMMMTIMMTDDDDSITDRGWFVERCSVGRRSNKSCRIGDRRPSGQGWTTRHGQPTDGQDRHSCSKFYHFVDRRSTAAERNLSPYVSFAVVLYDYVCDVLLTYLDLGHPVS